MALSCKGKHESKHRRDHAGGEAFLAVQTRWEVRKEWLLPGRDLAEIRSEAAVARSGERGGELALNACRFGHSSRRGGAAESRRAEGEI